MDRRLLFLSLVWIAFPATAQQAQNLSIDDFRVVTANSSLEAQALGPGASVFNICDIFARGRVVEEYWASVPSSQLPSLQSQGASVPNPRVKLAENLYPEARRPFVSVDGEILVLVKAYEIFDSNEVEQALVGLGLNILGPWGPNSWQIFIKEAEISALQNLHWVEHLEAGPFTPTPHGRAGRVATGAEVIQGYNPVSDTYVLSGRVNANSPIKIAIADGGVRPHDDLRTDSDNDRRYACLCHEFYEVSTGATGVKRGCKTEAGCGWDSHAQRMAGIALGDGLTSSATVLIDNRGQAPEAEYGDYPAYAGNAEIYTQVTTDSSHLVIHPQSTPGTTTYGVDAAAVDNFIAGTLGHTRLPQVWSAGNCTEHEGEEPTPDQVNQLKNAIVTTVYPFEKCAGGAHGPTIGGRVKPDLVVNIEDPEHYPKFGENWLYTSGEMKSSESAASVGGLMALLLEKNQETSNTPEFSLPSTIKALLVNTASDVRAAGPDHRSGFGAVDGEAAHQVLELESNTPQHYIFEDRISHGLQSHQYCFAENAAPGDFRATLVWDDRASCLATAFRQPRLVNDLELWMKQSENVFALPMIANPDPFMAATAARDRKNNIERIETTLAQADLENTALIVSSHRAFMVAGQDYSLVTSQPVTRCPSDLPQVFISNQPIHVDAVCEQLNVCDPCPGGPLGAALCPAFTLNLGPMGNTDFVELIDPHERTIARTNNRTIQIPERRPGQPLFLRSGRPINSPIAVLVSGE